MSSVLDVPVSKDPPDTSFFTTVYRKLIDRVFEYKGTQLQICLRSSISGKTPLYLYNNSRKCYVSSLFPVSTEKEPYEFQFDVPKKGGKDYYILTLKNDKIEITPGKKI